MEVEITLSLVIVILLILVFNEQISYLLSAVKTAVVSAFNGKDMQPVPVYLPDDDNIEHLDTTGPISAPGTTPSDTLKALGYSGNVPWDELLKATELDESTFSNHQDFVKDVRRFSSGSNFTSTTDDNTSPTFTNFVGLNRPQYVEVGPGLRTTFSEDTDILRRNKFIRFT